jgi:hypothetical protein
VSLRSAVDWFKAKFLWMLAVGFLGFGVLVWTAAGKFNRVVAGAVLGTIWFVGCCSVATYFMRRGRQLERRIDGYVFR